MEEPVRSQARLDQTKRLSNAILRRTVVNVVLFIVVYLVLFAGFMTTLGSAVSNFVYELLGYDYALHTLASNLFLVLTAIGFVAGIVLVVRSGINRYGAQHHQGDVRAERTRCEGRRGSQERAGGVSGA